MSSKNTVFFLAIDYSPYQGHAVSINGERVAFRPYDGSDSQEVENEIAEAFGQLLLGRLQEAYPGSKWAHRLPPSDWDYE